MTDSVSLGVVILQIHGMTDSVRLGVVIPQTHARGNKPRRFLGIVVSYDEFYTNFPVFMLMTFVLLQV